MKKVICSQKAPGAIGPYSQAIEANGMILYLVNYLLMRLPDRWQKVLKHRHVSHWRTSSISLEKQV